MRFTKQVVTVAVVLCALFIVSDLSSKQFRVRIINIENLSRYNEDRIAYQQIQKNLDENMDNSIASLMVIRDSKIYLFKDGYDDAAEVLHKRKVDELEHNMISDLWLNKLDNNPDYMVATDRRIEIMRNITQDYVNTNYGEYYRSVRDSFLKKHAQIFRSLIMNRRDSGLMVERKQIPHTLHQQTSEPYLYAIIAYAKKGDEVFYYAEDADGDGVTETFTVSLPDGFTWGDNTGPNIVSIINNQQKDIADIIGKLAHEAYYGCQEEEQYVKDTMPKTADVNEMIDDIYRVDNVFKEKLK